jgi:hypothetical protein
MRPKLFLVVFTAASSLMMTACAGVGPFKGNDTGGIIAWSPEAEATALDAAMDHCARYDKVAKITSVHRQYGDYIGFICRWPHVRGGPIVRARY